MLPSKRTVKNTEREEGGILRGNAVVRNDMQKTGMLLRVQGCFRPHRE